MVRNDLISYGFRCAEEDQLRVLEGQAQGIFEVSLSVGVPPEVLVRFVSEPLKPSLTWGLEEGVQGPLAGRGSG